MDWKRIARADVSRTISPNDAMFVGNESHYFGVGQSALECIALSLEAARKRVSEVKTVLDLPCGHGRVLRHLRRAFADADITACDLQVEAVDFCAATFGARPVYSKEDPAQISLESGSFDLIWVGSLLTHLDGKRWLDFLAFFRALLRPGGVLVFSAHGSHVYDRMRKDKLDYGLEEAARATVLGGYERSGFGYASYKAHDNYGISIASPSWVCARIAQTRELRICHCAEKAWDDHQDCFACVRDASWQPCPIGRSTDEHGNNRS